MSTISGMATRAAASATAVAEQLTETSTKGKATSESAPSLPAVQQDPKDKVGELKLGGQIRESQVRGQLEAEPQFKMPGVDVKGPALDDPKITEGFKAFEKPLPPVDLKWPAGEAKWRETSSKDGKVQREMTDADGNTFKETVDPKGTREREVEDKDGNRRYELSDAKGYVMRGGADTKGNSWTIDSNGGATRMHQGADGKMFAESRSEGMVTRQMLDKTGLTYSEKSYPDGKVEKELSDGKGNRSMEARDEKGFWMRGFADGQGNSYTVDSQGNSSRMHQQPGGNMYSESSSMDGTRTRTIMDKQGTVFTERRDASGNITRSKEKINSN